MAKSTLSRKTMFDFKIDEKSLKEIGINFMERAKFNNSKVTKIVAHKTYQDIEASGNIPVDTGKLENNDHVMKDYFDPTGHIIGWTTDYAKYAYFGSNAIKEWGTNSEGKRRMSLSYHTGIPYWDRPFTRNKTYMLMRYREAVKKVYDR